MEKGQRSLQKCLINSQYSKNRKQDKIIRIVALYFVITQVLSVLRATAIYNTSYFNNYFRIAISSICILFFISSFSIMASIYTICEVLLLLIPFLDLVIGFVNEQVGRDFFSDFFNALTFVLILMYYRSHPNCVSRSDLHYLARWELIGTIFSLVTYKIFPLIGYPIKSVGMVSNFLLFPLSYFLAYKSKWWIATAIVILIGGKRGVMISAGVIICYYLAFDKRRGGRSVLAIVSITIFLFAGIYFTKSPENIALLPSNMQRVAQRFMRVNPFSEYMDLHSDGRLDEIEGALRKFELNPINILFGKGNGYVYNTYHDGQLSVENNHNVHFTPVSFLTRYGVIYMIAFYIDYIWILIKSTKIIRRKENHQFIMCITLYLVGTFIDQFTVFLPYSDYQFMICLGLMNGILLYNYDCEETNNETLY